MRFLSILSLFFLFCQSCSSTHLIVQQEWIDQKYLASTFAGTPDPNEYDMEKGQLLTIGWDYPRSLFEKELTLKLTMRFWDDTQKVYEQKIALKRDFLSYFFTKEKILTYRIDIFTKEGDLLESWVQQLWTELISPEPHELEGSTAQLSAN